MRSSADCQALRMQCSVTSCSGARVDVARTASMHGGSGSGRARVRILSSRDRIFKIYRTGIRTRYRIRTAVLQSTYVRVRYMYDIVSLLLVLF